MKLAILMYSSIALPNVQLDCSLPQTIMIGLAVGLRFLWFLVHVWDRIKILNVYSLLAFKVPIKN